MHVFLCYFIIVVSFLNIVYIQHKCHKIIVEIVEPHLTTAAATHVRACLLSRLWTNLVIWNINRGSAQIWWPITGNMTPHSLQQPLVTCHTFYLTVHPKTACPSVQCPQTRRVQEASQFISNVISPADRRHNYTAPSHGQLIINFCFNCFTSALRHQGQGTGGG